MQKILGLFLIVFTSYFVSGCATTQYMKTGAGENIAIDRMVIDQDFKDDHLVKVALERDKSSNFYGAQATYMNDSAYAAFKERKDFPKDSKITLAFFGFSDKDGIVLPTEKMWSATMQKTLAKETGNWSYVSIDYNTMKPKFTDPVGVCYTGCHKVKEDNDYVFIEHPR